MYCIAMVEWSALIGNWPASCTLGMRFAIGKGGRMMTVCPASCGYGGFCIWSFRMPRFICRNRLGRRVVDVVLWLRWRVDFCDIALSIFECSIVRVLNVQVQISLLCAWSWLWWSSACDWPRCMRCTVSCVLYTHPGEIIGQLDECGLDGDATVVILSLWEASKWALDMWWLVDIEVRCWMHLVRRCSASL